MQHQQIGNEVKYKAAQLFLEALVEKGLLTGEEYQRADQLNRQLYQPQWAEVYP